jgi:hypothetical protein
MRSPRCLCVPPINCWMAELVFKKLDTYIMAREPIWMGYFRNTSHQSVCLYVYYRNVARQRIGKKVTVAMNTHETIEELLDASFSMRSVSYQGT